MSYTLQHFEPSPLLFGRMLADLHASGQNKDHGLPTSLGMLASFNNEK